MSPVMRIEIEPARTHDQQGSDDVEGRVTADRRWSDDEIARLRSEWDAEPGHR